MTERQNENEFADYGQGTEDSVSGLAPDFPRFAPGQEKSGAQEKASSKVGPKVPKKTSKKGVKNGSPTGLPETDQALKPSDQVVETVSSIEVIPGEAAIFSPDIHSQAGSSPAIRSIRARKAIKKPEPIPDPDGSGLPGPGGRPVPESEDGPISDRPSGSDENFTISSFSESRSGTESSSDVLHGAALIIDSRNWYQSQSQKLFRVLLAICPILVLSLAANGFLYFQEPSPVYFAVTPDFQMVELAPLKDPVISSTELIDWTTRVITSSLSLDFLNWRQKLMEVREDFEPGAFESLVSSLRAGGHLKKIEAERLSLSCALDQDPVLTRSGLVSGQMTWRLEVPVTVSYQSTSEIVSTQNLLAQVEVRRCPPLTSSNGLVISQMVLVKR